MKADLGSYDNAWLTDAYTGMGGYGDGSYLVAHTRETAPHFKRRQQIAIYLNFTKLVTNDYLSYLFLQPATRTGGGDAWAALQADADGAGSALPYVMAQHTRQAMIHGTIYLVVDRPEGEALTQADAALLRPYVVARKPESVAAAEVDDAGALLWIVFSEPDARDGHAGETVYRRWTREGWVLSEQADGTEVIRTGEHGLGRVPVVPLHTSQPMEANQLRVQPWIWDVAQVNKDLFNMHSEKRDLLRSSTFSILTLPVTDRQQREALGKLTISTENALVFDPTGGGRPAYVAPPPDPIELYQSEIDRSVEQIYKLAALEFVGGVQESGIALAYKFQRANRSLAMLASMIEQAELDVARLVADWMGEDFDAEDGVIQYPREFDLRDLQATLTNNMAALSMQVSPAFTRAILKKTARDALPGGDVDLMTRIEAEIDADGDPYGDRIAREAEG